MTEVAWPRNGKRTGGDLSAVTGMDHPGGATARTGRDNGRKCRAEGLRNAAVVGLSDAMHAARLEQVK